jgi:hypothetical protein
LPIALLALLLGLRMALLLFLLLLLLPLLLRLRYHTWVDLRLRLYQTTSLQDSTWTILQCQGLQAACRP